ncbi:MAG: phenylalanine--tRNA ligase beta subunit [Planctomycetota bacterium]|nr:MAG: phenylalanine--tRNA ligase beta subunit [Planctomycetota bacterium]
MRISYRWLKEYVEHELAPRELARLLTEQAAPVEGIEELPDGDVRIELEVTYNRPDLLSHLGVAREIAAATGAPVRMPEPAPPEDTGEPAGALTRVALQAPDLCPLYTARVIRGVRVGPSPPWLVARLEAVGLRPVNNVVDVTNLVLYECGQPLHAFDMARLAEGRIVVRCARPEERLVLIDGRELVLDPQALVIADAERPVALAGVMGGRDSEIGEATQDVLLESAYFDPVAIRRAVRRFKVSSDSSYRFERGADPAMVEWASRRAAALILELAGGRLAAGLVRAEGPAGRLPGARTLRLRLDRLRLVAGTEISRKQAARILTGLGLQVIEQQSALAVTVPSGRQDLEREIDLIEEVLRVHGYDRVPFKPTVAVRAVRTDERERALRRVREAMVAAGYREVSTISFVPADEAADPPLFTEQPALRVRNPVRSETPVLRRSLFAPLLQVKRINLDRGQRAVRLFEIGTAYLPRPGAQPDERLQLGAVADEDFFALKGALEAVAAALGVPGLECRAVAGEVPGFDPLERGELVLQGARLGWLGRIARRTSERFGLDGERPVLLLLDLEPLLARARLVRTWNPPPIYPEVTRDLAVVVDRRTYAAQVLETARTAGAAELRAVELLSVFEGDGRAVPLGKKSVAIRLRFQSYERTLTGEDAERGREAVKQALVARLGAGFRE